MRKPLVWDSKNSLKVVPKTSPKCPSRKISQKQNIGCWQVPRSSGPLGFSKFRWSVSQSSCIEIGSILCSFFITFHHLSNGGIRSRKPFLNQNGAPGTPGSNLNNFRPFASRLPDSEFGCFLSLTCLEFFILCRSKADFWKLCKLQNGPFSGTIPSVGNPRTFSKII